MTAFAGSLASVAGGILLAGAAGWLCAAALLPAGRLFRAERYGWSFAVGCALLAAFVPLSLLLRVTPGWIPFLVVSAAAGVTARAFRLEPWPAPGNPTARASKLLLALVALGVCAYALRALTEPMWANDFVAIWGLKGKTIFGTAGYPERFYRSPALSFSHPEYPLGLPLLYAGTAFLLGRWDDHAMALLFPLFQVATLCVLWGWLRRRSVPPAAALLSAGVLAWFEPLYSGFLTGMADVPLSFGALLLGTSLADALEETDGGALRRLAFASALIAAIKNEGLFLAAAAAAIALLSTRRSGRRAALTALSAALVVRTAHVPWRSRLPLADFDLGSGSWARLGESLAAAAALVGPVLGAGLALALLLVAIGGRHRAGDRILGLCACALGAYLTLPAFAVRGPEWLVRTTLPRTASALAPLACAAIAVRFSVGGASSGSTARPRGSEPRPGPPAPSTRES